MKADFESVDDEGRKRFSFDVLGDDDERLFALIRHLEDGNEGGDVGDLLFGEEDQGVLVLDLGAFGLVDEVGGDVAAVELHSLDHFDLVVQSLPVFHGDHPVFTDAFLDDGGCRGKGVINRQPWLNALVQCVGYVGGSV